MSKEKTTIKNKLKSKAPKTKTAHSPTKKKKKPNEKIADIAPAKQVKASKQNQTEPKPKIQPIEKIIGKKPVILQVLPELKSGGVERGTIEIAKAGTALGYEMIVASNGGHLVGQLENSYVPHISLPLASKNPFVIFRNISRLKKVIEKHNVDIIHARSRAPAWSAYFAAKETKCHFITTFHGNYSCDSALKKLYNSVMTRGEVVIAISDFIKKHILDNYGTDPSKIRVVPRGVDFEQFTRDKVHKIRIINMAAHFRIELDVPIILLPGRFTRWKGQEFLIDALALLKDEKFVCIFAGYDKKHESYYHELEKKVKENDLFQKVRMIGEVKDMPALYSLSDIVVSASTTPEAFGRVAIEGQAMEKLVVATNHGGSLETVTHGKNGWMVEPGDVEGLAKILKELLNISEKNRKTITTNARQNVEANFSMDNMVKKTFKVYNDILSGK